MKKPTVGIMRPMQYAQESKAITEELGLTPVICPMIETQKHPDNHFNAFIERVQSCAVDYVVFTSANGAEYTLKKISDLEGLIEQLNTCKVVAIGPATRRALEEHGIHVSLIPNKYSSEGLIEALRDKVDGRRVEIVRSTHGAPVLVEKLKQHGGVVHETCIYTLRRPKHDCQNKFIEDILRGKIDALAFTSTLVVQHFMDAALDHGAQEEVISLMNRGSPIPGAIGEPTKRALEKHQIRHVLVPEKYLFKDLLLVLREAINK